MRFPHNSSNYTWEPQCCCNFKHVKSVRRSKSPPSESNKVSLISALWNVCHSWNFTCQANIHHLKRLKKRMFEQPFGFPSCFLTKKTLCPKTNVPQRVSVSSKLKSFSFLVLLLWLTSSLHCYFSIIFIFIFDEGHPLSLRSVALILCLVIDYFSQ